VSDAPNARVLAFEGGLTARERLAQYLPEQKIPTALAAGEAVFAVVGGPAEGQAALGAALRSAGAFAQLEEHLLVVAGTRHAFAAARNALEGGGRALAGELLRALDAAATAPPSVRLRNYSLALDEGAQVMGILNVTPDSFYDGGAYGSLDRARARAAEMVALGARVIDIGGQSYAAGNARIAAEEERARVVPVVEALVRDRLGVALSIDTFKSVVAEAALDAGADLINDCSGLSDSRLAGVVARYDAALVVMHLKGELNVREADYHYDDALEEISGFLRERTERALAAGVARDALLVDPGLEFGKEPATDLEILQRFGDLRSLGYPILLAASRKSFIGRIFERPAKELLVPSLAAAAAGISAGAALLRVHDVAETVQLARMLAAVRAGRNHRSASAV